jgi:L-alanine-DL-glutamate epimerase-like enolase superfamily enzyme
MTKIASVKAKKVSHSFGIADLGSVVEYALVKISTDDGFTGIGFVPEIFQINGHGFGDLYASFIEQILGKSIIGRDPTEVEAIWEDLFHRTTRWGRRGFVIQAIGALDLAIWDVIGKLCQKPLWRIMGGFRRVVPTYANMGHDLPAGMLEKKASQYVKDGFDAIKIRGTRTLTLTPQKVTERIARVRKAIGSDVKLMVDLNGSYTTELALEMIKEWERYDLFWLEEPVHPDNIEGYRKIKRRTSIPIAAGEQLYTAYDFKKLIEDDLVDVVQPDVVSIGGITEWLKVWSLAKIYNLPVSPHLVPLISAHLVGAKPNTLWVEYAPPDNPLASLTLDVFDAPRSITYAKNGTVTLSEIPGHGIKIKHKYDF